MALATFWTTLWQTPDAIELAIVVLGGLSFLALVAFDKARNR